MKKTIILGMITIMMFMLCACGNKKSSNNVITIKKSEETAKYEEEVVKKAGSKELLSEENFANVYAGLCSREEQTFPKCTWKINLILLNVKEVWFIPLKRKIMKM